MDYSTLLKSKSPKDVNSILKDPLKNIPSFEEAVNISKKYSIPLHPRYLFYWTELTTSEFINFLDFIKNKLKVKIVNNEIKFIFFPDSKKRTFEKLGIEHIVKTLPIEKVKAESEVNIIVLNNKNSKMLLSNLGYFNSYDEKKFQEHVGKLINFGKENLDKNALEIINSLSEIEIRDKAGTYIGARMGRPEKAKMRKLDGRPHGLFPVGEEGGRLRNFIEAHEKKGKITAEFAIFENIETSEETIYPSENGNGLNKKKYFEKYTYRELEKESEESIRYKKIELETNKYVAELRKLLGQQELPKLVKGIKDTSNKEHIVEHLIKSFLRAKNEVYVNKDGTVRFDMIEMGLTHFKPKEIETSIEKLKELGYTHDFEGKELENEEQLVEIFPQDVILPDCVESGDELASDYIMKTGNFVDELLIKLYKLKPFYNFKKKEDTIGHLLIGLAPHTSAGIVGRIIGYSKTQGCFSHPVWHAAQRRNLDGDENGVMLLLDGLINFSRKFLPNRRGGRTMDCSLVLTTHLYLDQIDDEVHGMDIVDHYPLEFYRGAKRFDHPKKYKIEKIDMRLEIEDYDTKYLNYKFTHSNNNLNDTVLCSSYKSLPSMKEKLDLQLSLGKKIRAVDENKVGTFIIDKHFMRDIKGNLRKFSMQNFRCTKCNTIYRRPPLVGKCIMCGESSINFTISEGSIKKYLNPSFDIVKNYDVDPYTVEVLELTNLRIEGVFGKEPETQKGLKDYFSLN